MLLRTPEGLLDGGHPVKLPFLAQNVSSTALVEALAVLALAAVWFLLYAAVLRATAPADVDPLPASADLPPGGPGSPDRAGESPAVVSLLAGRWKLNEDAAEATLLDLAARRWIEFRQPGNDPTHTTVHLLDHPGGRPPKEQHPLTDYEEQVLAHVRTSAVDRVVPVTALTFRDLGQASIWTTRLHRSVIEHARTLGLSRRRFSPTLVSLLSLAAAVPAGLLALVIMERSGEVGAGPGAGLGVWAALSGLAGRPLGERDTPLGRAAAARWLGLRAFLRNDEAFAELPPAAVTVWDRYLSYGDALGVTRVCSALLDLGMGDRKRVWSSYGGGWHRVRVRYPRFWGRYGATVLRVSLGALGALAAGYFLVKAFGSDGFDTPSTALAAVGDLPLLLGLYLLVRGLYRLARLAADLLAARTVTGEVLWVELWKSSTERENKPSVPLVDYFAVDDGTADRTTAWACPSEWSYQARPGDVVTFTVRPWTRRLTSLEIVASRAALSAEAAEAAGVPANPVLAADLAAAVGPASAVGPSGTSPGSAAGAGSALGPLGTLIPGLGAIGGAAPSPLSPVLAAAAVDAAAAGARGAGLPAVSHLVSVDEVASALGRPVVSDGAAARVQLGPFELMTFSDPQSGAPVLLVSVARGSAVALVMRGLRRGGTPLSGIGDEAYHAPTWALGRSAQTLVRLTLEDTAPVDPEALPDLLTLALSRT